MARISEKGSVTVNLATVWREGWIETVDADNTKTHFAYNLGGGLAIGLAPNVNLDLEYRYGNFGKMSGDLVSRKYSSHELSAGLRYTF